MNTLHRMNTILRNQPAKASGFRSLCRSAKARMNASCAASSARWKSPRRE